MALYLYKEAIIMANINIRIDDALKQQADAVLAELGMNMTTATTVFLKQLVRHNGCLLYTSPSPRDTR